MFRNYSISKKLTWMNMLVSGAALLTACAAFVAYDLATFRANAVNNLSAQAQIAGSNSVSALVFDDSAAAQNTLSALRAARNIISAGIYTADARPFASYWRDRAGLPPELPPILPGQMQAYRFDGNQVVLVRSIESDGRQIGIVYVQSDAQALNARLIRYVGISAVVLMASLLAALMVSSMFRRAVAEPIVHLADVARAVSRDRNYSVRAAPDNSGAELSVLVDAFNEMLTQIQERDAALQKGRDELEQRVHQRTQELADANEAQRKSEQRFRLMVEGVKDYAIFMLDSQGRVATWNAGAERIKGYKAEEIIGQHFSRFYLAEDVEQGKAAHELKMAAEQGRFEDEGWRVRKDGSRLWANVIVTALRDPHGQLIGFSKITRDLTERKRTEQEILQRSTQLEAANKELEAFSYSVSHDLRAPLRSIDGFSQALLEDCSDKLDADGKAHLYRVRAATLRMALLIDDLLNLARVARSEMQRETIDLSGMARSIADELQKNARDRKVEFVITEKLSAEGDSRLLRVVMENLLNNAWKFTSRHDRARIEFGRTRDNGRSAYFVSDDGAGFDPRHAARLFGAFQRLHAMNEFPGTGVGLATVQRIIHRHGGRIWAEADLEKGATFYFTL